jgi:hypothetical protein
MKRFEVGDIVYLQRYNDHLHDWCILDEKPYIVIESGPISTVMGGSDGKVKSVSSAMLVGEEKAGVFKLCRENE